MNKVKLPRHVAEAIENLRENYGPSHVLWKSSRPEAGEDPGDWRIIHDFVDTNGNNFILADALRYGYEIEAEPITVTITPEQQEQLRQAYDRYRSALDEFSGEYLRGIRDALTLAGIIGSALLEQAHRCRDETRARLNRLIASKVYEARRRHHEAAGAVLMQRYFREGCVYARHHRSGP